MEPQTAGQSNPGARQLWPWLAVVALLLLVGFIRVRLLAMPLERDEGEYAYCGQLLLQGIPPYELAYNLKLPGTGFACAVGMALFGQTPTGLHLTLLLANSLTIIFVFLLGRKLFGPMAAAAAASAYAVMSLSMALEGLATHANQFVVLFAMPATLLLLNALAADKRRIFFYSGLLYGLAFLMKQQGFCFFLFGLALLGENARRKILTPTFLQTVFIFGLGMLLPFALTCGYLAMAGVFWQFWFWTFSYSRAYVATVTWPAGGTNLLNQLKANFDQFAGFWLILLLGIPLLLYRRRSRRSFSWLLFFTAFSFIGTAAGLYFRGHYFILSLPAFALMTGASVESLRQIHPSFLPNVFKTLPLLLLGLGLSWFVFYEETICFKSSPDGVVQNYYRWNPFLEARAVGNYVRANSKKTDRIAVFGSEPEVYFYAQRHSATGYLYMYPMMEAQPYALRMQRAMIHEVESSQPEYLVYFPQYLSWLFRPQSDRTLLNWLDQYSVAAYRPVGVIHVNAKGVTQYFWDDAVKTNPPDARGGDIVVFKRKTNS
jgi:hypothetical protein